MTPVWDPWALAAWCTACGLVILGLACAVLLPARSAAPAGAGRRRPRPEVVWTVVALVAVVAVAVPGTRARLGQEQAGGADLTVEVRASRWRWEYTYLDGAGARRFGFVSTGATPADVVHGRAARREHYLRAVDRPLVIPTGRKVRFLVTSADVVHAFWVPDLGIRSDAVPGVVRTVWTIVERPGIYRGQCAAFCGERHALMPIVVEARSPQAFETWQSEAAQTLVAQARVSHQAACRRQKALGFQEVDRDVDDRADGGLRWPRPRGSFGPVRARAPSTVVPAMLSVASTRTGPKSSAIITAPGEKCGLAPRAGRARPGDST